MKQHFSTKLPNNSNRSYNLSLRLGGTNTGVMKYVGEAVRDRARFGCGKDKINLIGIATWGILEMTKSLISKTVSCVDPFILAMTSSSIRTYSHQARLKNNPLAARMNNRYGSHKGRLC